MDGMTRSAILMMSLGEDAAAEVFKYLSPREVQQFGAAMANLKQAIREDVCQVLEDFRQQTDQFVALTLGSDDYIRGVLTKALGSDRAAGLIDEILDKGDHSSGIEALNWLDSQTAAELIGDEHPQIIATLLVHLERDRAAGVLALLAKDLRNDVMMRIATFGGVHPAALAELTEVLNNVLVGLGAKRNKMGGVRTAAEILNMMPTHQEEAMVESLHERDSELTQKILDEMFIFANMLDIEDRHIQVLLKEIENDSLIIALKGASDALLDKFLRSMSTRAAETLREELAIQGPIRRSRVEAEQKNILQAARRLAESGQIELSAAGDDSYV